MDLADCSHHTASSRHHTIFCVQDKPFAEMVAAKSTKSTHSTSSSTRLRLRIVKTLNGWKLLKCYEVTDPCEELPDFNACDCFRTRPLNGRANEFYLTATCLNVCLTMYFPLFPRRPSTSNFSR